MRDGLWLKTLIHMDEPEHFGFRALTKDGFSQELKKFQERVKQLADDIIEEMLHKGEEIDFKDVVVCFH